MIKVKAYRDQNTLTGAVWTAAFTLGLAGMAGMASMACTPATPERAPDASTPGTGGATTTGSGGSSTTGGSGGSVGSGGAATTGSGGSIGSGGAAIGNTGGAVGTGGSSTGSSGGAVGSGGASTGSGGASATGGRQGTGGATGTGGRAGTGGAAGAAATMGCNWTNPQNKIVLFDGTNMDQWKNLKTGGASQWRLIGDGTMEVVPLEPPTDLQTKMKFEDLCVHVEYMTPMYPSSVSGQSRGNSGVYLKSAYEMQILDSIGQPPAIDSCGAIYSLTAPLVVACNMELVWNTYEIEFKASVWDATGKKTKNAVMVLATLNGKVVQRNVEMNPAGGFTQAGQPDAPGPQSLMLQDHRNLVRFRNIWVTIPAP